MRVFSSFTVAINLEAHLLLALEVAPGAAGKVRPPGSLVFIGGTGARRPRAGLAIVSTATAALPTLIASLALELARSAST
jgi:NAD(P)-dependent dehydrogenase (short-subunit alcohol dehydrogenase family)